MHTTPGSRNRSKNIANFVAVSLGLAVSGLSSQSAQAASATWTGGAVDSILPTDLNWSTNVAPVGNGDVATWNGTVAGNLSLSWTAAAGVGPTSGANGGLSINVTSEQIGTLTFDSTAGTNRGFGLGNITIANGAGAFALGNGDSSVGLAVFVLRGSGAGGSIFTNNDNDTATIRSDVRFGIGAGDGTIGRAVTFTGSGNWNVDATLRPTGAGVFNVIKSGAGTLTFSQDNRGGNNSVGNVTPGGIGLNSLTVNEGTVEAAATGALGGPVTGTGGSVTLNAAQGSTARVLTTGAFTVVNNFTVSNTNAGTAIIGGNHATGTSTYEGTVTLNAGATFTATTGGEVVASGAISGAGGITKIGGGTLTLTNANTYTGATNVDAGTLLVSGAIGSSATTVNSGGAIGAGSLAAPVGTGTTGALSLTGTGTFNLNFNIASSSSVSSDLLNVSGGLTLSNTAQLSLSNLGANVTLDAGTTFTFIDYADGGWNGGTFAGLADDSRFTFGANEFQISYNGQDGNTSAVVLVAVPEPASAALLVGGAVGLFGSRRSRRRAA